MFQLSEKAWDDLQSQNAAAKRRFLPYVFTEQLFNRDKSFISRHLRNIYKEGALSQTTTVAKNATVQIAASRNFLRGAFMFQQSEKEWDVLQSQKKVGGAQYDLPLILSTVSSIPVLDIKSYGQKTPIGVECE